MNYALLVKVVNCLCQFSDVELRIVLEKSAFFVQNLPEVSPNPDYTVFT